MLMDDNQVPGYHLQDVLLCYMGYLYVPSSECAKLILEAHYNRVAKHYGLDKTIVVLQKYFY